MAVCDSWLSKNTDETFFKYVNYSLCNEICQCVIKITL